MTARFTVSRIDHRKLTQPWFQIARQSPGRRRHVHGHIRPMPTSRKSLWARIKELIA